MKMNIAVNDSSFTATLAENAAVDALEDWIGRRAHHPGAERLCRL